MQNIPGWDEVPVKDYLEERLNKLVAVNNNANCFALGEYYFGKGRGYDFVVGLTLGSGLGSGLVLGGTICEAYRIFKTRCMRKWSILPTCPCSWKSLSWNT